MPTYGYECRNCGNGFETFQRITEDALTKCEICGGELKKKIFPVGIVFKGSGFYVNDYAAKSEKAGDAAPAKEEPKDQASAAPVTEGSAAPAAATESKSTDAKTESPVTSTPAASEVTK